MEQKLNFTPYDQCDGMLDFIVKNTRCRVRTPIFTLIEVAFEFNNKQKLKGLNEKFVYEGGEAFSITDGNTIYYLIDDVNIKKGISVLVFRSEYYGKYIPKPDLKLIKPKKNINIISQNYRLILIGRKK